MHRLNAERRRKGAKRDGRAGRRFTEYGGGLRREERMERGLTERKGDSDSETMRVEKTERGGSVQGKKEMMLYVVREPDGVCDPAVIKGGGEEQAVSRSRRRAQTDTSVLRRYVKMCSEDGKANKLFCTVTLEQCRQTDLSPH